MRWKKKVSEREMARRRNTNWGAAAEWEADSSDDYGRNVVFKRVTTIYHSSQGPGGEGEDGWTMSCGKMFLMWVQPSICK